MALFEERCKTAGETIKRTVDGVESIVWMKWREEYSNRDNFADQWKLNDPYGRDCGLEDCIAALLRVTTGESLNPPGAKRHSGGYKFVETIDPRDKVRYRYTASLEQYWNPEARAPPARKEPAHLQVSVQIRRQPVRFTARYGVEWNDISTREDREHWIAGGSLKVIDLQTDEVIAERMGYMVDRGQGSQAGGRSPWLFAEQFACPSFPRIGQFDARQRRAGSETRRFVVRILNSASGE